jgi:GAF domain-containing protein/HPt (histidine-containing phosphotransfer) domain-containing protein
MDSTLLNQVRHLCRDRASYEHLKAILVQQERVHQLSWEDRYEQLVATQTDEQQTSNIFGNILVREKALAQLADAIQRSPSLDLVLQVAVQVAQKLLQVDRVAIFRCDAEGRGEFTTDAIAAGLISLADMPERQLSLSRHMIESTQAESSIQIVDSIRASSLSSHIVILLEQIGISSYTANKIYAGQGVWGTLVAFHSSVYHVWTESDRTSLSLVATQISVAIALANLRLQTQELSSNLQVLQVELNQLQQTVTELAEHRSMQSDSQISTISEIFPELDAEKIPASIIEEQPANIADRSTEVAEIKSVIEGDLKTQSIQIIDSNEDTSNQLIEVALEISQNLVETTVDHTDIVINIAEVDTPEHLDVPSITSQDGETEVHIEKVSNNFEPEFNPEYLDSSLENSTANGDLFAQVPIDLGDNSLSIDDLQVLASEPEMIIIDNLEVEEEILGRYEPYPLEIITDHFVSEKLSEEPSELKIEVISSNDIDEEINEVSLDLESEISEVMVSNSNIELHDMSQVAIETELENIPTQSPTLPITLTGITSDTLTVDNSENLSEVESPVESLAIDSIQVDQDVKEPSELKRVTEQMLQKADVSANGVKSSVSEAVDIISVNEDEHDPTIELQFIETIVAIAESHEQGVKLLLNVIDSYLEEAPRLVQAIDKALAVNDHARLLEALNSLRANSDYVGALTLSYQCRQLESAVKANYVVLIYASLSQVAIEAQRATDALRVERSRYSALRSNPD